MLISVLALAILLVITLLVKPGLANDRGGKIFAFVALFLLPSLGGIWGFSAHLEASKRTEFCLSCHPMLNYGKSLLIDDPEYVPANHFQNNLISREQACYTCHTDYTLYGDFSSKIRGLRHLMVQYIGDAPDKIELYSPYNNRECLHCHGGMRSFEENAIHSEIPATLDSLRKNSLSCLSSGCHDAIHDANKLEDLELWKDSNLTWIETKE